MTKLEPRLYQTGKLKSTRNNKGVHLPYTVISSLEFSVGKIREKERDRAQGCSSVVQHLPITHDLLSSVVNIRKEKGNEISQISICRQYDHFLKKLFCLHVCLCTMCMSGAQRPEKGAGSMKLESQMRAAI